MKKIILNIFPITLLFAIFSCTSNDDTNENIANNIGYSDVTLLGETIHNEFNEGEFTFSRNAESCNSSSILIMQSVGQINKPNYFIDIYLVHNENKQQFQGYDINITSIKNNFDLFNVCYNNFDLVADFEDKLANNYLDLNTSSANFNKIESVSVYKENVDEIIYAVKGNFEVTLKKPDNTLIPIKGSYKTFIYVLK